jgi:hypothetical protein
MARDPSDDFPETVPVRSRRGGKALLMLGVAGACALGVGAGLWARPAPEDQNPSLKPAPEPPQAALPTRTLQIVVDDTPAPFGPPIEVLPGTPQVAAPPPPAFVPADPEPIAPLRPPALVRVQAIESIDEAPQAAPPPRVQPKKVAKVQTAKPPKAVAKAEKARPEKPRLAKAARAPAKAKAAPVRKAAAKPARPKAKVVIAQAKAPAKAHSPISRIMAKLAPHPHVPAKVRVAQEKPARAKKKAQAPARPLRSGSVTVASARSRCVSPDPGAAIVCADPALSAADRRLLVAYREAEAAGVSPAQLKRQQARWLQARSAAAREAPWAVHDVYLARIAELNDQARDARGGGW